MKNKIALFTVAIIFSLTPVLVFAQEDINAGFNPNQLITDATFSDTKTFGGAAGVQKFLESKNSPLANTSAQFVALLKEPNITILKQSLSDPEPSLDHNRSAAELIWDAAQVSGLNPQVILVTLNKEQSLITGRQTASTDQMQRALDFALGFGCPDSAACGDIYRGFYFQLFGNLDSTGNRYLGAAGSLIRSFNAPGGRGPAVAGVPAKTGDTITLDNTLGGYNGVQPQQIINLSNNATAALYRYTPHVFNGNYNFWKFFNSWFRYPNGTLIKGTDGLTYIIQNGTKQSVTAFVAQTRGLNISTAIQASQNELDGYPTEKPYTPADNTIISVDGKLFVFTDSVKHPASSFIVTQRGLNPASAVVVSASDVAVFVDGPQLTPSDGTVLRGTTGQAVYSVQAGTLKLFVPLTFAQRNAGKLMQIIPDDELATYPKSGYVPPANGSLVKPDDSLGVFVVEEGSEHPLTAELFRNRGYKFANISIVSHDVLNSIGVGAIATPHDNTFYKIGGQMYWYKDGTQHAISSFVSAQKKISSDFNFGVDEGKAWPTGTPISPRDGTIIKGDASQSVFFVQNGQLKPLTAEAFAKRKIKPKQISVLPQAEVDSYAKGDTLTQ